METEKKWHHIDEAATVYTNEYMKERFTSVWHAVNDAYKAGYQRRTDEDAALIKSCTEVMETLNDYFGHLEQFNVPKR